MLDSAPDRPDSLLFARAAAVREEEAIAAQLEARLGVVRASIETTARRMEERQGALQVLQTRKEQLDEGHKRLDMLHEGVAACELRLSLSRQRLADSGQQLEALRLRGMVVEERSRSKAMELGSLSQRLQERKQQLAELQRRGIDERVRVGLAQWRPRHVSVEALERWRAALKRCTAHASRVRSATKLWRSTSVRRAWGAWRVVGRQSSSTGTLSLLETLESGAAAALLPL